MTHPNCEHCGSAPMLQTSGAKARNKWARVQCSNYNECGMQTPQIAGPVMQANVNEAWRRWDRRVSG